LDFCFLPSTEQDWLVQAGPPRFSWCHTSTPYKTTTAIKNNPTQCMSFSFDDSYPLNIIDHDDEKFNSHMPFHIPLYFLIRYKAAEMVHTPAVISFDISQSFTYTPTIGYLTNKHRKLGAHDRFNRGACCLITDEQRES